MTGNGAVLLDTFAGTPPSRRPFVDAIDVWIGELVGRLRYPRPTIRFDGESGHVGPVTRIGELNDEILGGELGLSADELGVLRASTTI